MGKLRKSNSVRGEAQVEQFCLGGRPHEAPKGARRLQGAPGVSRTAPVGSRRVQEHSGALLGPLGNSPEPPGASWTLFRYFGFLFFLGFWVFRFLRFLVLLFFLGFGVVWVFLMFRFWGF